MVTPKSAKKAAVILENADKYVVAAIIRDLASQVESLEADAERMSFLDSMGISYGFEDLHEGVRWEVGGPFLSVRDAIDAEMEARKQS